MAEPVASLPMYDWPETHGSLEKLWSQIAIELSQAAIPCPGHLVAPSSNMAHWKSPDLLLSQTCGWPYANQLRDIVIPFARFDYGLTDCPPGYYRSVFIGHHPDNKRWLDSTASLSNCPRIAINGEDSQSGFHVFAEISGSDASTVIQTKQRIITGAHRQSIIAVANEEAEIAAIDGVAFELASKYERDAFSRVHVLGYSNPKPGLPLITSLANKGILGTLFEAVFNAVSKLDNTTKSELMIKDVLPASDADYQVYLNSQNE